jgi:biotin carboxyl carrier protein
VSEPAQHPHHGPDRSAAERAADHAAIDRLADELLPALIAKLGATGLGELEVREGGWRVRLRRPAEGAAPSGHRERRSGERERGGRGITATSTGSAGGGAHAHALTPVGPGRDGRDGTPERDGDGRNGAGREVAVRAGDRDGSGREAGRTVATSPAVGIFRPRSEATAGTRIRAGDRLGSVDMLGVAQEVVAPADGVVGASLVEPGDAVEYGQDLILIEFASAATES